MANVGVVVRLPTLQTNELHDFVFTFAGNICIGKDHAKLQLLPERIISSAIMDVISNGLRHFVQEVSSRSDDVRIERLRQLAIGELAPLSFPILTQQRLFALHFLALLSGAKSASSLLIHLGSWSYTIDGHVHNFLWPNDADKSVQVQEDVLIHVLFIFWRWPILWVAARVNNTIHVQIEIIKIPVRSVFVQIHRNHTTVHFYGLPLDGVADNLWIPNT
mmetsp:Transcript_47467/g.75037  ORF Transcript_47467/g.75037 Transcript_47467/m.75037 type:complete len:219 (-) Transcript_47467:108-764(-)